MCIRGANREPLEKSEMGIEVNVDELTPEERLRLLERLWESLSRTPDALPLTREQRQELDRRLDDMEGRGAEGIPWQEVLQRIRSRRT